MRIIRTLVGVLSLMALLSVRTSGRAQEPTRNEPGVAMGHLHLNVRDVEASEKFWVEFGGTAGKVGPLEVVQLPGLHILFHKVDPSGGSEGSIVNHVGFIVPNGPEFIAKWKAAGLKTEMNPDGRGGYLYTPDGLRVEILEDKSLGVPIKFDHVHFFVPDAGPGGGNSISAIQAWYAKVFGAQPGKRGPFEDDVLPGGVLLFTKSATPTAGTQGRSLDHIGFAIKNLEAFCKNAEANGVKFDVPYTKRPDLNGAIAYLTDPWGTYIELTETFASGT